MKALFYTHSWRTFLIALNIFEKRYNGSNECIFITTNEFVKHMNSLGLRHISISGIFNVDPKYSNNKSLSNSISRKNIPKTSIFNAALDYSNDKSLNNCISITNIAKTIKSKIGPVDELFLPHMLAPLMQLIAYTIDSNEINFIEEGCTFPRHQCITIKDENYGFDIINSQVDTTKYFAIPNILKRKGRNLGSYICTRDNLGIKGISLSIIEDNDFRMSIERNTKNLSIERSIKSTNLIHVGSKEECMPNILFESITLAKKVAKYLGKIHVYVPHPSMKECYSPQILDKIMRSLEISYTKNACLERDMFCEKDLYLIGDITSIMITAKRLGHKFYNISDKLGHVVQERSHHDWSVKEMVSNSCEKFPF